LDTFDTRASAISFPVTFFVTPSIIASPHSFISSAIPSQDLKDLNAFSANSDPIEDERFFTIFPSRFLVPTSNPSLNNPFVSNSVPALAHSFSRTLKAVLPAVLRPTPRAVLAPIQAGAASHPVNTEAAAKPTSSQAC